MLFSFIAQINEALLKHEYSAVWWLLVDIFMTYQHSTRLTDNFFARQKNVSALQTWNKDDEKKIKKILHASEITLAIETIGGFYQWFPYAGWLPNTNGCQETNSKKTILKCDDREERHKFFFF